MKTMKKLSALVLALVMVFAMSATAFAVAFEGEDETSAANVTVVLQKKEIVDTEDGKTATNITPIVIPVVEKSTVTIDLNDLTGDTVYDVINALPQLVIVPQTSTDPSAPANCTWKQVYLLDENWEPTEETAHALNSLAFKNARGIVTEANTYTSNTIESTSNTYKGWDWTYSVTTQTDDGPVTDEPYVYMDQYTVTAGQTITLTYGYSDMSW